MDKLKISLISLMIIAISLFISGIMFMVLWNFIAPTFSLPVIDFWIALAISLIISVIGGCFNQTLVAKK